MQRSSHQSYKNHEPNVLHSRQFDQHFVHVRPTSVRGRKESGYARPQKPYTSGLSYSYKKFAVRRSSHQSYKNHEPNVLHARRFDQHFVAKRRPITLFLLDSNAFTHRSMASTVGNHTHSIRPEKAEQIDVEWLRFATLCEILHGTACDLCVDGSIAFPGSCP